MAFEKNPDELGALWVRRGAKGEYLTGQINGLDVVCFAVKSDNPKAPAWRVLKSKPKTAAANDVPVDDAPVSNLEDELPWR
jgi:hypothetical protein